MSGNNPMTARYLGVMETLLLKFFFGGRMDEKALSIVKDYIAKNEHVVHKTDNDKTPLDVKIIYRNEMQFGDVEYLIENEIDPDLYFELTYCSCQHPYWNLSVRQYIVVDEYKIFDAD